MFANTTREIVGEYGMIPLYRSLGYFSVIGLLRVHVLLGDYTLALKIMDRIELNQKVFYIRSPVLRTNHTHETRIRHSSLVSPLVT